jgi:hypothetical protein
MKLSVGQPLAGRATDLLGCPLCVINPERRTLVLAEVKLAQIPF